MVALARLQSTSWWSLRFIRFHRAMFSRDGCDPDQTSCRSALRAHRYASAPCSCDNWRQRGCNCRRFGYATGLTTRNSFMKCRHFPLAAILVFILAGPGFAQQPSIVVASTTSTEQSGLFGFLLPRFTEKTGIAVRVVAVGTGQALDMGRRGDADVVFGHGKAADDNYLAVGFGLSGLGGVL